MIVNWKDAVAIPSIPGSSIDAVNRELVETSVVSRETVLQFKEYLVRSTDQASMSFEMAGMVVSVHLFLDMQYGVLVVNGGIFDDFQMDRDEVIFWPVTLSATVFNFMTRGMNAYVKRAPRAIEPIEIRVHSNDIVMLVPATGVCRACKPLCIECEKGTGLPVILRGSSLIATDKKISVNDVARFILDYFATRCTGDITGGLHVFASAGNDWRRG